MPPYHLTDRANTAFHQAVALAEQCRHSFVGTEHILFTLQGSPENVAATAIRNVGGEDAGSRIRLEFRKLAPTEIEHGTSAAPSPLLTRPKLSSQATEAMHRAFKAMEEHSDCFVGCEHILLGLLGDPQSAACQLLINVGIDREALRREVFALLGTPLFVKRPWGEQEWVRTDGQALCMVCKRMHREHPSEHGPGYGSCGDEILYLHRLCDGALVKL